MAPWRWGFCESPWRPCPVAAVLSVAVRVIVAGALGRGGGRLARLLATLLLVGSVLEVQGDAAAELVELAVLGREARLEAGLVRPLAFQLLQPAELDEQVEVHGRAADVGHLRLAGVEQLV